MNDYIVYNVIFRRNDLIEIFMNGFLELVYYANIPDAMIRYKMFLEECEKYGYSVIIEKEDD